VNVLDVDRRRIARVGRSIENVQYENASHLLMGFGPGVTEIRVRNVFTMHFGGTAEGTETARNAGWARAKEFLSRM